MLFVTSRRAVFFFILKSGFSKRERRVLSCSSNPPGGSIAQRNVGLLQACRRPQDLCYDRHSLQKSCRNLIERLPSEWKRWLLQRCCTPPPQPPLTHTRTVFAYVIIRITLCPAGVGRVLSAVTCCVRGLHELYAFSAKKRGAGSSIHISHGNAPSFKYDFTSIC